MAVNPAGFVQTHDYGIPQFITARTQIVISGGFVVYAASGTSLSVSSGANSFAYGDFEVNAPASGTNNPIGIAVHNAGSNAPVTIMTRGVVILPIDGAAGISPGELVTAENGAHAISALSGATMNDTIMNRQIGKALLGGISGTTVAYALV